MEHPRDLTRLVFQASSVTTVEVRLGSLEGPQLVNRGQVMKESGGKASPELVKELVESKLS